MSSIGVAESLQHVIWHGSLPLEIRLASSECRIFDEAEPYLVQYPRLAYLPVLLPRLHKFFQSYMIAADTIPYDGWFEFEDVALKWQYPLGLLHDLFSGAPAYEASVRADTEADAGAALKQLPWRLVVHFSDWPEQSLVRPDAEGKVHHDAYINSVKEADFLRNGTAKGIMSLSKDASTALWTAAQTHDREVFEPISKKLLHAQGAPLRHIPVKVYLPSSSSDTAEPTSGHLRVVQSLVTPYMKGSRERQTVGTMMHSLLPALFPSRRTPVLARVILHGVVLPMSAMMEELMRMASYLDGWLHIGVVMIG